MDIDKRIEEAQRVEDKILKYAHLMGYADTTTTKQLISEVLDYVTPEHREFAAPDHASSKYGAGDAKLWTAIRDEAICELQDKRKELGL